VPPSGGGGAGLNVTWSSPRSGDVVLPTQWRRRKGLEKLACQAPPALRATSPLRGEDYITTITPSGAARHLPTSWGGLRP